MLRVRSISSALVALCLLVNCAGANVDSARCTRDETCHGGGLREESPPETSEFHKAAGGGADLSSSEEDSADFISMLQGSHTLHRSAHLGLNQNSNGSLLGEQPVEKMPDTPWLGPKIVGVGWKKTGTTSLGMAYTKLGILPQDHGGCRCTSPTCLEYLAATQDAAACCDHKLASSIADLYPVDKVKFVLTERQPAPWIASVKSYVKVNKWRDCWYSYWMGVKYNPDNFTMPYIAHNLYMKKIFKDSPGRLLVIDVTTGDPVENMGKLCDFVGREYIANVSVCDEPFPHENNQLDDEDESVDTLQIAHVFLATVCPLAVKAQQGQPISDEALQQEAIAAASKMADGLHVYPNPDDPVYEANMLVENATFMAQF